MALLRRWVHCCHTVEGSQSFEMLRAMAMRKRKRRVRPGFDLEQALELASRGGGGPF